MLEVVLTIPFWLELAASLTGGISGAMSAVRARYDLFGVCCIAIVTGLAGGIIRDILLQNYGIYAFQKPQLIVACVVAGIIVFYFSRLTTYLDPVVNLLDNLSVALWAIISVGKSMSAGMDIIPAAILGTITAVGGGICRDVCMNREPISFQAGALYGTAAFIGALVYALMNQNHVLADYAPWACVALVLGIRYGSLLFGWHTKPPRDYTDVIARPAKAVANKVVRAPKGKVARDKERGRRSERLHRLWLRMNGEFVPMPGQTGKLQPIGKGAAGEGAGAGASAEAGRDPFEPATAAAQSGTGRNGAGASVRSHTSSGTDANGRRDAGREHGSSPEAASATFGDAARTWTPDAPASLSDEETPRAKPANLLPIFQPAPDSPFFDDTGHLAVDEPHGTFDDGDATANPSLTGRFATLPQKRAQRRAERAYRRSVAARAAVHANASRGADDHASARGTNDRIRLTPEQFARLRAQLQAGRKQG